MEWNLPDPCAVVPPVPPGYTHCVSAELAEGAHYVASPLAVAMLLEWYDEDE